MSGSAAAVYVTCKEALSITTSVSSTKSTSEERAPLCDCCKKANCPLDDRCREKSITDKASVDVKTMTYYSSRETNFKARYYNHIQSYKNPSKRIQTEFSKLV